MLKQSLKQIPKPTKIPQKTTSPESAFQKSDLKITATMQGFPHFPFNPKAKADSWHLHKHMQLLRLQANVLSIPKIKNKQDLPVDNLSYWNTMQ